jgi:hypothetical protein
MRGWVLVLVLANLAFFVWTQGWVSPWLPAPWQGQREPQRVLGQVNPEGVAVRRVDAASSPAAGASAAASGAASRVSAGAASVPPGAAQATGAASSAR